MTSISELDSSRDDWACANCDSGKTLHNRSTRLDPTTQFGGYSDGILLPNVRPLTILSTTTLFWNHLGSSWARQALSTAGVSWQNGDRCQPYIMMLNADAIFGDVKSMVVASTLAIVSAFKIRYHPEHELRTDARQYGSLQLCLLARRCTTLKLAERSSRSPCRSVGNAS